MDSFLLAVLRIAGPGVLLISAWAVWQRRLTFGSRYDAGGTAAVALFGVGTGLDTPLQAIAAASAPLAGRHYLFNALGHLCFLFGAVMVVRSIYQRLLPDGDLGPFIGRWVLPPVAAAATIMVIAFLASPVPSTTAADHLYLTVPDGWVKIYAVAHLGTAAAMGAVASYGVTLLFKDPRSVMLNLLLGSLMLAAIAGGVVGAATVVSERFTTLRLGLWLATYTAFAGGAIAAALQWRYRAGGLIHPPR